MIRNYNIDTAFASLAKPTGIGKGYFHNNDAGFTLDYLYGPYDVPENEGLLQFTYEDEDENTIIRPNLEIDGQSGSEGTWDYNQSNEPVYNTRLDYQKALAEQMLRDMDQFFVGKKVAFITEEGKAKEYVVVPIPNTDPVELEFEDADLVDIYTVKFMTINGSGAQADVETVTKFYTLPQSLFIPPKEELNDKTVDQLFKGWYFGYMDAAQHLVIDESTLYRVGQSANLQTLCEQANITDRTVTFYAKYMEHDDVLVDFENGYYKADGDFVNLDGGDDMDGYMLVQNGLAANNTKPEDWDLAYSSYFTRYQADNYGQYVRTTYNWVHNNGYTAMEWNETNFRTYFPTGHYDANPKKAICPYNYGTTTAPYFVVVVETEHYFLSDEPAWWEWKYYKFQTNPTNTWKYVPCTSNYASYEQSDLYTHAVKDTIALFNNGSLIGNVVYDCMDNTTPQAYQGLLAQLNTYIPYSYYSDRFEFDRWEITPKKITDDGVWETDQTMGSWTDSHVNATVALDSTYETEVDGETVTYPADAYVFRAVYRKRDEYYSRLQLDTNCEASGTPSGEIQITCKYKKPRRPNLFGTCTVGTYNASGYHLDQALANSKSIQLGDNGFEFDPSVIVSFTLTAVANTTNPVTIPYCWTGNYIGQSLNTTLTDIPVEGGITKSYKAWFVYEGDINATVKVKKRLSTAHTNVVLHFGGSRVGIFDWKLKDNQTGTIINGHTVGNMAYMYDHSHLLPGSSVPITNQDSTYSGTLEGPFSPTTGNQGRWQKVINEERPLDNPASIALDETGHGYCFIKAIEAQDGARFIQWSDGDTNPVKLVDVTVPTLYSYTAIFQGTPLSMVEVEADYADMANMDYAALVAVQYNANANNNTDINILSRMVENGTFALPLPDGEQFVYVHVPGVGLTDNPEAITEYNNVATVMRSTIASAPSQDGTVTYDYNGTQYKETLVETGKDITLAY